jgi:hypothetical protein
MKFANHLPDLRCFPLRGCVCVKMTLVFHCMFQNDPDSSGRSEFRGYLGWASQEPCQGAPPRLRPLSPRGHAVRRSRSPRRISRHQGYRHQQNYLPTFCSGRLITQILRRARGLDNSGRSPPEPVASSHRLIETKHKLCQIGFAPLSCPVEVFRISVLFGTCIFQLAKQRRCRVSEPSFPEGFRNMPAKDLGCVARWPPALVGFGWEPPPGAKIILIER